jgi:hypothetical protein
MQVKAVTSLPGSPFRGFDLLLLDDRELHLTVERRESKDLAPETKCRQVRIIAMNLRHSSEESLKRLLNLPRKSLLARGVSQAFPHAGLDTFLRSKNRRCCGTE